MNITTFQPWLQQIRDGYPGGQQPQREWMTQVIERIISLGYDFVGTNMHISEGYDLMWRVGEAYICCSNSIEFPMSTSPGIEISNETEAWEIQMRSRSPLHLVFDALDMLNPERETNTKPDLAEEADHKRKQKQEQ